MYPSFTGAHEVAHYWWGHRGGPGQRGRRRCHHRRYGRLPGYPDHGTGIWYLPSPGKFSNFGRNFTCGSERAVPTRSPSSWPERTKSGSTTAKPPLPTMPYITTWERPPSTELSPVLNVVTAMPRRPSLPHSTSSTPSAPSPLIRCNTSSTTTFETITLYDNTLESVVVTPSPGGQFQITVGLTATKYRSDAKGTKSFADADGKTLTDGDLQSLPLADYLRLGFYTGDEELSIQQVRVDAVRNTFSFLLPAAPNRVVLDPEYLLAGC